MLAAFARILLRRLVFEDGLLAAGAADEVRPLRLYYYYGGQLTDAINRLID